ncbi:hypothetical protein ARTSIC4J27_251 [Pseudarthrobacter siccitolerans]|uniref:Uncharacterized protein n=1 Tax=Pseudarthrobacter siccitolerans TaxID=861266 RepID=A0A024GXH6_9MICC|nr:hypothetical protein [Pseudarthrobacter siccitolerans]CCQ44327.1 hypothetical protein ARTSIC4J27_251 [Pseudarthrobacter siccitolerans]
MPLSPLDSFYLTLGQIFASLLYTAFVLGVVVLIAYICARVEIRQERTRKEARNES